MAKTPWWRRGVRFECQGCGGCCVTHGECGVVYVTAEDRKRLAASLGLGVTAFARQFCRRHEGRWVLRDAADGRACIFLRERGCAAYEARPTQCRTWPFWPELMRPKAWQESVVAFCPGAGKGERVAGREIAERLRLQREADAED